MVKKERDLVIRVLIMMIMIKLFVGVVACSDGGWGVSLLLNGSYAVAPCTP
jgi:hypothetical protein